MTCGTIVTWTINNLFINRGAVVNALTAAGIANIAVPSVEPRTYLRRAIKECDQSGLIRVLSDDAKEICYAIVDEETDGEAKRWEGRMRTAITMDKTTGEITFTRNSSLQQQLQEAIGRNLDGMLPRDIGSVFKNILTKHANAIPLRETGGVYFVPETHRHVIDQLDTIAQAIAKTIRVGKVRVNRFEIVATNRAADDVSSLLDSFVTTKIENYLKRAEEALADDKARVTTIEKRQKDVMALIKDSKAYEQALGVQLSALKAKIKAARLKVIKLATQKLAMADPS